MEKNNTAPKTTADPRSATIVRTSIIGIIANIILVAFKAVTGLLTGSIAIILDAVNNLTDAISSVVTIVGAKLAAKRPDRKHPMGYGRIEYLGSLIVAGIILYAGITSFIESVRSILDPGKPEYSIASIVILVAAVIVKLFMGRYVRSQGIKAGSTALEASGSEALFDAILSAAVLASALIYKLTGFDLEAYVGVAISIMIVKTSIEMLLETVNDLIGKRSDADQVRAIKRTVKAIPGVRGAFDVVLNSYGPNKVFGSLHIEVPDTYTADAIDDLTRRIERDVQAATGVVVTAVGIYAQNTKDEHIIAIRDRIVPIAMAHDWAIGVHGFYADPKNKIMRFDVVTSFDKDFDQAEAEIVSEISALYPDYDITVKADADIS